MKLLILTQVVDTDHRVLGFFHAWIEALALHFESIEVVCLQEGRHALPDNVHVYSLGKEGGHSRLKYLIRFYAYAWDLRLRYDAVFVHMNEEYAILGGLLWKVLGKRVYMWRNFHAGSVLTDIAAFWCKRVFCTSRSSYTARYKRTQIMPVGVELASFTTALISPPARSVLSLGRMAEVKRIDTLVEALVILSERGHRFRASIYGDAPPEEGQYLRSLIERVEEAQLTDAIQFHAGITHQEAPDIYKAHELFVNASPSGMYDKTILEAAASGVLVLAASKDFASEAGERFAFDYGDAAGLASRIEAIWEISAEEAQVAREHLMQVAQAHSLSNLGARLAAAIHQSHA